MHTYCTKSVVFSYLPLGDDERECLEAFSPIYLLNLNDFYSHYLGQTDAIEKQSTNVESNMNAIQYLNSCLIIRRTEGRLSVPNKPLSPTSPDSSPTGPTTSHRFHTIMALKPGDRNPLVCHMAGHRQRKSVSVARSLIIYQRPVEPTENFCLNTAQANTCRSIDNLNRRRQPILPPLNHNATN